MVSPQKVAVLSILAILAFVVASSGGVPQVHAAPTYTAIATGDFASPSTWQGGNVPPGINDYNNYFYGTIIINPGVQVTFSAADSFFTQEGTVDNYGTLNDPLNAYWYDYGTFNNFGTLNLGSIDGNSDFAQYSIFNEYCGATLNGPLYYDSGHGQTYDLCPSASSATISTSLSAASINAGQSVYDSASLSGAFSLASGNVQYEYFSSSSCTGSPTDAGSAVEVGAATVPDSQSVTFSTSGSYGWKAVYSGDSFDSAATSACEPLTVTVPVPTVTLSPTSGLPGTAITLSGGNYNPGSSYSYCFSTSSTSNTGCLEFTLNSFSATAGGSIPASTGVGVPYGSLPLGLSAGSYYVIVFSGSTILASSGFTVEPLVPTISLSPTSGLPGTATTLSGGEYIPGDQYSYCLSTSSTNNSGCLVSAQQFFGGAGGSIPSGTATEVPNGNLPYGTPGGTYYVIVFSGTTVISSSPFHVVQWVPTLSLSSSSGNPGAATLMTGGEYVPGFEYSYCFSSSATSNEGCSSAVPPSNFYASASGQIPPSIGIEVPDGSAAGSYYVIVFAGLTVVSDAPFTVTTPQLSISPTSVPDYTGGTTALTGVNFAPGNYFACLSTSSSSTTGCLTTPVGGYVVGSGGSYSGESITVPPTIGSGSFYVIVYAGTTVYISAPFTVTTPPAPTFSISPTSVADYTGGTITLTGANFALGNYFACLSTTSVSTTSCVTSPVGGDEIAAGSSYTGSYSGESISVPSDTASGSYYAIVYASGSSTPYASASFAINSPPAPTFSILPTSVADYIGTTIALTGANFAPSNYFACLSTSSSSTTGCLTTPVGGDVISAGSGYTGSYSGESITVPPSLGSGDDYVIVYAGTTVYVSAPFTIFAPLTVTLGSSASTIVSDGVSSATFTASPAGGSGTYTNYVWNLPSGLVGTWCTTSSTTCTITSTTPGPYSVSVTVTDSDSETTTSNSVSLTVQQSLTAPTVTPGSNVYDALQQESFTVSWTGGTGPYTVTLDTFLTNGECFNPHEATVYTKTSVSGDSATFSGIVFSPALPGDEYYCATVVDSSSPPETAQSTIGTITINSDPSGLTISASPTTLSQGGTSLLSSVGPTGGTSPYTYQWSVISPGSTYDIEIPGATDPTYSFATTTSTQPGTYIFFLTAVDSKGLGTMAIGVDVTVSKVATTTSTTVFDAAASAAWSGLESTGASAYDTAIVVGEPAFVPTGTVTYSFYSGTSCSGTAASQDAVTLLAGVVPQSSPTGALAAGPYAFQASYSGDSNYAPSTGACEFFAVNPASSSISTEVVNDATASPPSGTEVTGASFHDTATVSGVSSFVSTGTVTYQFFNGACTGEPSATVSVSLVGGVVSASTSTGPLGAGSYGFIATYTGDSNYLSSTGACELFTVSAATPAVATSVYDALTASHWSGSEVVGASAYDTSTVTGVSGFTATGSVTYQFFADGACSGAPTSTSTESLVGGAVSSSATTALGSGSYGFSAAYSGDSNYVPASGNCESFSVNAAPSSISTAVSPSATVTLGTPVSDTATISGGVSGFSLTGDVVYSFYSSPTCSGAPLSTGSVAVSGGSVVYSPAGPLAAGPYSFGATYSGDSNYLPSTGACEPFTVSKGTASIATAVSPSAAVLLGTAVSDSATATGVSAFAPTGSVTIALYSGSSCSGNPVAKQTGLSLGAASTSETLGAGHYSYMASGYSGDANYVSGTSGGCEPFTVNPGTAVISTTVKPSATLTVGTAVSDTATATGVSGFTPTGTMTVSLYPGSSCTGTPVSTQSGVALGTASTATSSLAVGSYSFKAVYSGDANYFSGTAGPCEQFSVQQAASSTAVACSPNPVTIGSSTTCTATVTGYHPNGSVKFSSSSSTGVFASNQCTLSAGACSVSYTDTSAGTQTIGAAYGGDASNLASSGSTALTQNYKACNVTNGGGQNLKGADLEYCNLAGYQMGGANLMGADLQYTNLKGTNLQGANLMGANVADSDAAGASFQGSNLMNAVLKGSILTGDNFQGSNLMGADLSYTSAENATFQGANLKSANMSYADFSHDNFQGVNMMDANMSYGMFDSANFTGANTNGVNITGATFVGAINPP